MTDRSTIARLQAEIRELSFLHETSQVLTATLDLDSVLRSLMAQVRDFFQVEAASAALLDDASGQLIFRVAVGRAAAEVVGLRLDVGQGIAGWVVQHGEPALVSGAHDDDRFYPGVDESSDFYTDVILAVPIRADGHAIGVIEAINPQAGGFDQDAQRLLSAVADLAAVAIRNAALYERVRQAESRYESLFNESTDPIFVLAPDGEILNLNRRVEQMLERPRQEIVGQNLCDTLHISRETCLPALRQVLQGDHLKLDLSLRLPLASGGEKTCTLETHMSRVDYGGRTAIQWVGHDISERVALERMREDLTHMVVHDLRNPLGSIMSSLQLIHTAFVERDQSLPILQLLGIAMRSGERMYRLIDSLLDLGRLESQETELDKKPIAPASLVKEAVEQVRPLAMRRRQTIATYIHPDLPAVAADEPLIVRVLTNLLDNAVKFTPTDGHIAILVQRTDDRLLFSVSNDGPGIPPEHRERIFDRFSRLEAANGIKGTGLGLAFCKLAVEAHGGRIWITGGYLGPDASPAPPDGDDQGVTFHFTLPLST